jgi:hypothetical protein
MSFRDLADFLIIEPIDLPVGGKTYRFPGTVSGRVTLQLRLVQEQALSAARAQGRGEKATLDTDALANVDEKYVRAQLFTFDGHDVEAEMIDDGCSSAQIDHVMNTLIVWHTAGKDAAEQAWEAMAADPQMPNREQRRAASSASVSTTSARASTSSTGSRKPRAKALPGPKSSTAGA